MNAEPTPDNERPLTRRQRELWAWARAGSALPRARRMRDSEDDFRALLDTGRDDFRETWLPDLRRTWAFIQKFKRENPSLFGDVTE